ncbi:MAG TPA: winged helix-turn-helix domain-containing protein [Acidobacteriaceae bacterium]|jgi:DNA-binding winged helix-turn-helix (wHTH) protein|nr:winged helix-turn-helix domain-containing protein [Acidobacteriaceae bacterium]
MSSFSPGLIRFGSFEFDSRNRELRKHGMRVRLTPHEMSLLCLLLEPPLRVRTRDEIQRQLWSANTFVDFEHGMNKVVHSLREALGDSATNPRYIETVNATGYRFIPQFLKPGLVEKRDLFNSATSIAVLPITTSGSGDLAHRCDRITFHLVAGVSALHHRVIAHATLRSYKLDGTAPRQAGEILGVDVVISGELVRNEGTLSLRTELIDVSDGSQLCGAYSEVDELAASRCEEQLAAGVLQQFRPVLVPRRDNPQLTFDSPEFLPLQNGKPIPRLRTS